MTSSLFEFSEAALSLVRSEPGSAVLPAAVSSLFRRHLLALTFGIAVSLGKSNTGFGQWLFLCSHQYTTVVWGNGQLADDIFDSVVPVIFIPGV